MKYKIVPKLGYSYTCPNSGMIVQIAKIRFIHPDYMKVWIKYFNRASRNFMCEERNVKLVLKNIQHWQICREIL